MPLSKLDIKPTRAATLWDITCDSDGEIAFDANNPLFLHSIDLKDEEYFLGFFLVGAYQEVLGMNHNLFAHPTEATITVTDKAYLIQNIVESPTIVDILENLNYDTTQIKEVLLKKIENSSLIPKELKNKTIDRVELFLKENGYLKTVK
jgi:arginine decarboxylase